MSAQDVATSLLVAGVRACFFHAVCMIGRHSADLLALATDETKSTQ